MIPPRLETDRLALRGPASRDVEAAIAFFGSERARHVGGPRDRTAAWRIFATVLGHWTLRGFGFWTVTLRDDDRGLGLVGCWRPEGWPEPEIGWMLWAEAEGRGLAREAAEAARRFAFVELGWPTAVSYVLEGNVRSRRLAERLGAMLDPTAAAPPSADGTACLVYRHPHPEPA